MKTIRNTKLFNELKDAPFWSTLFNGRYYPELKDLGISVLAGGFDHIEVKKAGVYFHDIGMSVSGKIKDHSFVVRPELEKK